MASIKISIVVPVYNSERIIPEFNRQVNDALKDIAYELILVFDKSKDQSWKSIQSVCALNPNVIGVSLRKNSGQDNAIMAGLQLAKGDYVVIMDDDLQHSPYDILSLYNGIKDFDVCYALFLKKKQAMWKNAGSWFNGKLSEKLLSKPAEVYLSPFKILKGEVAKEIIKYKGPYPYIDALLLSVTENITQITVSHHERFEGESNFDFVRSVRVFLKHGTGYSVYPLRLATYFGFWSALLAFFASGYYLVDYFINDTKVEGWISLVLIVLFFFGVVLICLGIIGEYVGRMFLTINNKPQYTIDKVVGKTVSDKLEAH